MTCVNVMLYFIRCDLLNSHSSYSGSKFEGSDCCVH